MGKINFTRTVNPLQFDALDPKRFEDLVRQLLYDFRPWRQLEATGRSGSDDGFDARGWEVVDGGIADAESEDQEASSSAATVDRVWLVQCKRERTIGPKKLVDYLEEIAKEDLKELHGIIFVACTDFSKKARDDFRAWCAEHGIREFHLWGKAELEDALFQPKNDGLLFAYFGLSLSIRRRSEQARLRAQTTTKRKLKRIIDASANYVLLRDVADQVYPFKPNETEDFGWWVYPQPRLTFRGLELGVRRYFAFIDDDGEQWDYANVLNDGQVHRHSDPWRGKERGSDQRQAIFDFWDKLPQANKAWLDVWAVMPFSSVVEVDELGDDITEHPHVYVTSHTGPSFPFEYDYPDLHFADRWGGRESVDPKASTRVEKFPAEFRKPLPQAAGDEED